MSRLLSAVVANVKLLSTVVANVRVAVRGGRCQGCCALCWQMSRFLCIVVANVKASVHTGSTRLSALAQASMKSVLKIQRPPAMPAKLFADRTSVGKTTCVMR